MSLPAKFHIRPALPSDREAVFRFCEHTWEGGDFIPRVWDRWMAEPQGLMLVASAGQQPVALAHVMLAAPGEAWLEGLRVDPEYRRQGLGTQIVLHSMAESHKMRATMLRFATVPRNEVMRHLAARMGFEQAATFFYAEAQANETGPALLRPGVESFPGLLELVQQSAALKAAGGLYSTGWRFHSLDKENLRARLVQGMVRVLDGEKGAIAIVEPGYLDGELSVAFADGESGALAALALGLRAEAKRWGSPRASARLPHVPHINQSFLDAGYHPAGPDRFLVFQRNLPGADVLETTA